MKLSKKYKARALLIVLLFLLPVLLHAGWAGHNSPSSVPSSAKPGSPAPSFLAETPDGAPYRVRPGTGKPLLLNFWASWCKPCAEELPTLTEAQASYSGRVDILAVNLTSKDDPAAVRRFIREHAVALPVLLDPKSEAADLYRIAQLPATYAVDKQGIVVERRLGPLDRETLERILRRLTEE